MNENYSKDKLFSVLLENFPQYNTERVKKAFEWAYDLHGSQIRKSGEPYIIHPINVARQLMQLDMDEDTIIAALLHDVIEDCEVTYDEIKKKLGTTVADLVQAETKVDDLTSNAYIKFSDYNNLKRMLIAMTDDVRVLLIRLSDRLHNMKTIQYLKPERQITYSQETLNVYAPLAEYINIGSWKRELEELAFQYVYPEEYKHLEEMIDKDPRSRPENIQMIQSELEEIMHQNKIPCAISGRIKSVPSLHNKINKYLSKGAIKEYTTEGVNDLLAFRIITSNNNIIDCYKALGAIHSKYKYLHGRFDDYIAKPKFNGYQSLQTDIEINGLILEVQIRTKQMHEFNEFGTASHISYKSSGKKSSDNYGWVKNLIKWQSKDHNQNNYSIKNVLSNKIFVFTPKGQVIEMTKGANVVDFAYRIHTKVGNSCTGAKINGKIVPLDTKIKTSEIVEIITSKTKTVPNKEWIKFCQPKTVTIIKREISKIDIEKQIETGRVLFKLRIKEAGVNLDNHELDILHNEYSGGIEEEFYRRIALKMIPLTALINKLVKSQKLSPTVDEKKNEPLKAVTASSSIILVKGHKGMQYYIAKCCNPTQHDELIGFLSMEHGVTVHNKNCKFVQYLDQNRLIEVSWGIM